MLPTKRELGKRGGRAGSNRTDDTDAEMNPQVDTGVSSFCNDRGSNPVEARNEPAREISSLQWGPVREIVVKGIGNACYGPPPIFSPEMDPAEWLESMEDFFVVTGVPSSHQAASARLSDHLGTSPELKRRLLDTYGHSESLIQLAVRFNDLKQRKNQSIREFAQEVAELGRRAGKSENELVARFICGVAWKKVHRGLPELETEVGGSRQRTTENADAGKDNLVQAVEALTRRFDQLETTLERSNSRRPARRATECFRCGEQGHFLRDCPQRRVAARVMPATTSRRPAERTMATINPQTGNVLAVPGRIEDLKISFHFATFFGATSRENESGLGEPDTSQVTAIENMEAALDGSAETRQICFAKLMGTWSRYEEIITKLLDNAMDQKSIDVYTEERETNISLQDLCQSLKPETQMCDFQKWK
ncbi:hypothetical protein T02_5629 [Trichinella nativa]|uniref:CCHC-type domain-containing protein n=1 Tax=Trichinella nativa TaxID=6335 RepID=A0A0V1KMV4_9BILA|nr:hypothetical protein T02_5629 [Trichinella nativa]